jgi:predicted lysophospholipase L1 biosynthesis ABC-type transport system permease subunit
VRYCAPKETLSKSTLLQPGSIVKVVYRVNCWDGANQATMHRPMKQVGPSGRGEKSAVIYKPPPTVPSFTKMSIMFLTQCISL